MCIPDVLRALTEATVILIALLLSGAALVVFRCVFAAGYYLEGADDDDRSLQDIFTSDEMWDWDELTYWLWALAVVAVVWVAILALLCAFKGVRVTWNFLVDWMWRNVISACCGCWTRDSSIDVAPEEHHHHHHYASPPHASWSRMVDEDEDPSGEELL